MINFPGPDKILLLLVIALVVLGPSRLPSAARTAGRWLAELRKLTGRFQEEMHGALADPKDALTAAVGDLHREVGGFREEIAGFTRSVIPTTGGGLAAAATTWAGGSNGASVPGEATYPSSASPVDSVSGGLAVPALPPLPPAPDDPSLN
ncbi:MAG TPA: twin-arginine translocase TatA/TatE family subunit [Acidimicrobiales bacterium]|nr:twin-arginine translocase TatA/TatE family subunit [Acidimicrobiales bacterium]